MLIADICGFTALEDAATTQQSQLSFLSSQLPGQQSNTSTGTARKRSASAHQQDDPSSDWEEHHQENLPCNRSVAKAKVLAQCP
ncbi:hypothetical protein FRB94_012611, partial [Tulasnella sp. JGI-2019a]